MIEKLIIISAFCNGIMVDYNNITFRPDWIVSSIALVSLLFIIFTKFKVKYKSAFLKIIFLIVYLILITVLNNVVSEQIHFIIIYILNFAVFFLFFYKTTLKEYEIYLFYLYKIGLIIGIFSIIGFLVSLRTGQSNIFVVFRKYNNLFVMRGLSIEPNIFGLQILCSYTIFLFKINKQHYNNIALFLINGVFILCIYLSYTRSVWIMLLMNLLFYSLKHKKFKTIVFGTILFIIIGIANISISVYMKKLENLNPVKDSNVQVRLYRASVIINYKSNIFQKIFGNGVGAVKQIPAEKFLIKSSSTKWTGILPVYWYSEFGYIGLLFYILIVYFILKKNKFRNAQNIFVNRDIYLLKLIMVNSLFVFLFTQFITSSFLWTIAGIYFKLIWIPDKYV